MRFQRYVRENARTLLMVVMSLLLVAFLVPDAVQGCQRRDMRSQVLGEAFGRKFTSEDVQRVLSEIRVAESVLPPDYHVSRAVPNEIDQFLLFEEARQSGVRVAAERLKGLDDAVVARVARAHNCSKAQAYKSLGDYMAMLQTESLQQGGVVLSPARLARAYRDEQQTLECRMSVLDAAAFMSGVGEPTEEQLVALFEAGKNRRPAHTEDELVFGYQLSDRVQVEYLTVDPKKILSKIQVLEKEAREFYEQNKSRYTKRVPKPTTQATQDTQPTQPARPEMEVVQLGYDEVKDQVRNDKREAKAIAEAQRLLNDVERAARAPWDAAEVGKDFFHVAPPDAESVSFEALRDQFSRRYPVEYHRTELLDRRGLQMLPGIGRAAYTVNNRPTPFADIAMKVKGLATTGEHDAVRGLVLYEPGPIVSEQRMSASVSAPRVPYQSYVFRVIRIESAAPPASMDAVRQQVIDDWKLSAAFAKAGEYAHKLAERAREVGLAAAAAEAVELRALLAEAGAAAASQPSVQLNQTRYVERLGPFTPAGKITRRSQFLPDVGMTKLLAGRLFDAIDPASTTQSAHRVVVAPIALTQRWVVAEPTGTKPIYQDEYEARKVMLRDQQSRADRIAFTQDWYDSASIRQRVGYVARNE